MITSSSNLVFLYGSSHTFPGIPHSIFESVFFLFLGGRIDHGHHGGKAVRALNDAIAMAKACGKAADMTDRGKKVNL